MEKSSLGQESNSTFDTEHLASLIVWYILISFIGSSCNTFILRYVFIVSLKVYQQQVKPQRINTNTDHSFVKFLQGRLKQTTSWHFSENDSLSKIELFSI